LDVHTNLHPLPLRDENVQCRKGSMFNEEQPAAGPLSIEHLPLFGHFPLIPNPQSPIPPLPLRDENVQCRKGSMFNEGEPVGRRAIEH
jgi:hypothetical protein